MMVPQQLSQHTHSTQDRSPEGCRLLYGRVVTVRGFRVARILPVLLTPSFLFESVPLVPRQIDFDREVFLKTLWNFRFSARPFIGNFMKFRKFQEPENFTWNCGTLVQMPAGDFEFPASVRMRALLSIRSSVRQVCPSLSHCQSSHSASHLSCARAAGSCEVW